jgi:hypothetical protein
MVRLRLKMRLKDLLFIIIICGATMFVIRCIERSNRYRERAAFYSSWLYHVDNLLEDTSKVKREMAQAKESIPDSIQQRYNLYYREKIIGERMRTYYERLAIFPWLSPSPEVRTTESSLVFSTFHLERKR